MRPRSEYSPLIPLALPPNAAVALRLLAEMRDPRRDLPDPDVVSYNTTLGACAQLGRASEALALLDEMWGGSEISDHDEHLPPADVPQSPDQLNKPSTIAPQSVVSDGYSGGDARDHNGQDRSKGTEHGGDRATGAGGLQTSSVQRERGRENKREQHHPAQPDPTTPLSGSSSLLPPPAPTVQTFNAAISACVPRGRAPEVCMCEGRSDVYFRGR